MWGKWGTWTVSLWPICFCVMSPPLTVCCPPQLHTLSDSLWGPDDSRLQLNFRATQPLNGRIIEASFPAGVDGSPRTVEPGATLSTDAGTPPPATGPASSLVSSLVCHWWSQPPALTSAFSLQSTWIPVSLLVSLCPLPWHCSARG